MSEQAKEALEALFSARVFQFSRVSSADGKVLGVAKVVPLGAPRQGSLVELALKHGQIFHR
jgi:hypothetical protein